jgi:hypothetical protein
MSAPVEKPQDEGQIDMLAESESAYFIDPAKEKTVLRKIDLCVMPAMVVVFFFQC